jgi:acyl carrier protein
MEKKIKKLLADTAGVDYSLIYYDLNLKDDLFLDDNDIEEIMLALEDFYDVEFEIGDKEFILVEDIISFVKDTV